jgi:hypothetical protein
MLSRLWAARRALVILIVATLVIVTAAIPTWCAVSGLWR